jgi:HSP20 family protein
MTLLTRWEPFREFSTMQERMNRMNRLFRESYSPEVPEEALTTTNFAPPVDIYEDEHTITLKLDVPGMEEKDIDVRIEGSTLTVHGERKIEKEEKEENYRRVERQYGSFTRSFTLPSSVDTGQVNAHYDKGQLGQREDPRIPGSTQGRVKPVVNEKTGRRFYRLPIVCHPCHPGTSRGNP